jgi:hypothetical protein
MHVVRDGWVGANAVARSAGSRKRVPTEPQPENVNDCRWREGRDKIVASNGTRRKTLFGCGIKRVCECVCMMIMAMTIFMHTWAGDIQGCTTIFGRLICPLFILETRPPSPSNPPPTSTEIRTEREGERERNGQAKNRRNLQ